MTKDTHLTPQTANDGAGPKCNTGTESREPLSGEPSGRSHRDGLSAAPSPVDAEWVEAAGKIGVAIVLGFITGVFCFVLWQILEHGAQ